MIELKLENAYKVIKKEGFNSDAYAVLLTGTYSLKAYRLFMLLFNKVEKSYEFNHKNLGFDHFPYISQFALYYKTQEKKKYQVLSEVTPCTFAEDGQIVIPVRASLYYDSMFDILKSLKGYFQYFFRKRAHGETKETMRNLHLLAQLYGFEQTEDDHNGYIEIIGHPLNPFEAGHLNDLNEQFMSVQNDLRRVFKQNCNWWGSNPTKKTIQTLVSLSEKSKQLHDEMESLLVI